jgi:hypothetical protein
MYIQCLLLSLNDHQHSVQIRNTTNTKKTKKYVFTFRGDNTRKDKKLQTSILLMEH